MLGLVKEGILRVLVWGFFSGDDLRSLTQRFQIKLVSIDPKMSQSWIDFYCWRSIIILFFLIVSPTGNVIVGLS
jgi:hypothetical protein